jgi:hypothetical protein
VLPDGWGGGPGAFQADGTSRERTDWVTGACTPVSGLAVTLYDCAGAG